MINMVTAIEEHVSPSKPVAYATYQRHINRYIFAGKFIKDKVILDIGCGAGLGIKYWLAKGAKEVVGIDIDDKAVKEARNWNKGTAIMVADAQTLSFPDSTFDTIVALEVIEHLKDADTFLAECWRVLNVGGTFICSTPNRQVVAPMLKKPRNPHHLKEFNPSEFHKLVGSHFPDTNLYGQKMLSLKDRIKPELIAITDNTVTKIFGNDGLRELLLKVGKPMLAQPHYSQFNEDFEGRVDKDYMITELNGRVPETLVVVARKGK